MRKATQPHLLPHASSYHNYKNGESWAGGRGTDKLKMDSLLGSLSIIKVFRLVARNKHFSATDFTDFLKNVFTHF